jgi:hypothetical protein
VRGEAADWRITDHLLAGVWDALNVANWQRAAAGNKKVPRPEPIPRPGESRQRLNRAELHARLLDHRRRHAGR